MALEVGTNAYLDVETATLFFEDRLDADAWHDADADRQAQALVTATKRIDREPLLGKRANLEQVLAFPRCQMTGSKRAGGPLDLIQAGWVCDEVVPQAVLDATCEQALFLLSLNAYERDRLRQHTLGVIGVGLGNANEYSNSMLVRQNRARTILCPEAKELLRGWLAGSVRIR